MSEAQYAPLEQVQQEKEKAIQNDKIEAAPEQPSEEIGGPEGLEPTRYGDWERKGRCIDF